MIGWATVRRKAASAELVADETDAVVLLAMHGAAGVDDWCEYCNAVRNPDGRLPLEHAEDCPIAVLERVEPINE